MRTVVRAAALVLICCVAVGMRLLSLVSVGELMIRGEDVHLHQRLAERVEEMLGSASLPSVWNGEWHDTAAWHPEGRRAQDTMNPMLVFIILLLRQLLRPLGLGADLDGACVVLGPMAAAISTFGIALLGSELGGPVMSLSAAMFLALVPAFGAPLMAGDVSGDGLAVPALLFACYLHLRAARVGSIRHAAAAAAAFMVAALLWQRAALLVQLVAAAHIVLLSIAGRASRQSCTAYLIVCLSAAPWRHSCLPLLGAAVATLVYFGDSLWSLLAYLVAPESRSATQRFVATTVAVAVGLAIAAAVSGLRLVLSGAPVPWTSAVTSSLSDSLLSVLSESGPALRGWQRVALAAQVSLTRPGGMIVHPEMAQILEVALRSSTANKPASWASFGLNFHLPMLLLPHGLFVASTQGSDAAIFVVLWTIASLGATGLLLRFSPLLAPPACLLAGLSLESLASHLAPIAFFSVPRGQGSSESGGGAEKGPRAVKRHRKGATKPPNRLLRAAATISILGLCALLGSFAHHSAWVARMVHSQPTLVQIAEKVDGTRLILDDRREAYAWVREHVPRDATIAAWWDHGHQITHLAQRRVLADASLWGANMSQLSVLARAFLSDEESGAIQLRALNATYVLVKFGGLTGEGSDDLSKVNWMARIAQLPRANVTRETLIYRLAYCRFAQMNIDGQLGFDRARDARINPEPLTLTHIEEVFTSAHWLVRIYHILPRNQ